jgi:hypothetical protein
MSLYKDDQSIDGLLFEYKHFYGHYNYIGIGSVWYKNEIRIIKNNKKIRSYKDAQGFRMINDHKLRVKKTGAFIYHYGWVKPPIAQQAKQKSFHKMWHNDKWIKNNIPDKKDFDYGNADLLEIYNGTHPAVFETRIKNAQWNFIYDKRKVKINIKYKIIFLIEKLSGWRIGENKNYKL